MDRTDGRKKFAMQELHIKLKTGETIGQSNLVKKVKINLLYQNYIFASQG